LGDKKTKNNLTITVGGKESNTEELSGLLRNMADILEMESGKTFPQLYLHDMGYNTSKLGNIMLRFDFVADGCLIFENEEGHIQIDIHLGREKRC